MPASDFDREELREERGEAREREPEGARPRELEWASAVGNSAVQRIARSSTGARAPVAPSMMPLATGVLARQSEEEEEEGEGAPTATAEPAPEATPEPAAAPEGGEEELEEEETG